jgi:hypothetical protein
MGKFGTVDLLVLTSYAQLLFELKILYTSFYKTYFLKEEVNCTEASTSVSFPWSHTDRGRTSRITNSTGATITFTHQYYIHFFASS